jgi:hypothetical protein
MNARSTSLLAALAVSLASTLAGCGSSADNGPAPVKFSGVYRPIDNGAIGSITFSGDHDYLLVPTGCAGQACSDVGTYDVDQDRSKLLLLSAIDGTRRTITVKIIATSGGDLGGPLVQSLHPRDLVDPGGSLTGGQQQLTTGSPQETTKTGQDTTKTGQETTENGKQLTEAISKLIETVTEALMDGQKMKGGDQQGGGQGGGDQGGQGADQNKDADKDKDKPPINCQTDVPTKDTPPGLAAAYWAACPGGP